MILNWNTLSDAQRLRILIHTSLPTCLMSAKWEQLTQSERDAVYLIDWEKAIGIDRHAEVLRTLCAMCSEVGRKVFREQCAHDCFCGATGPSNLNFQFSDEVLEFVTNAVREKIEKERI